MYVAELCFSGTAVLDSDSVSKVVYSLLGAWRMNGQLCGREWPITSDNRTVKAVIFLPDRDALERVYANRYVAQALTDLEIAHLTPPSVTIRGQDIEGVLSCTCPNTSTYILFTNYLSLESPLRCGNCFQPIPLYRIPATYQDEYVDILRWQSDYQACDTLQMNCETLERAATRELGHPESSLAQRGRSICQQITAATTTPTYYRLYRYGARSEAHERKRRCPICAGAWLLPAPWHQFDFKCDQCVVVSNIAWDVRSADEA
jgi:predicted  nucleic acid-binding Zn ribbon protein